MKEKALKKCASYTDEYAECVIGRTLFVGLHCSKEAKKFQNCLRRL